MHSVPFSSRASSPTIGEGHPQKKCRADNQDRSSQETEKQNEEAESPFHKKEQSLLRRAIRILLMLFIILGIIVIFMIASQYVYLEWDRILRSLSFNKCMNGFVRLRFVGMYNPPIWTDEPILPSALNKAFKKMSLCGMNSVCFSVSLYLHVLTCQ